MAETHGEAGRRGRGGRKRGGWEAQSAGVSSVGRLLHAGRWVGAPGDVLDEILVRVPIAISTTSVDFIYVGSGEVVFFLQR